MGSLSELLLRENAFGASLGGVVERLFVCHFFVGEA
jgi:hypothetical protein